MGDIELRNNYLEQRNTTLELELAKEIEKYEAVSVKNQEVDQKYSEKIAEFKKRCVELTGSLITQKEQESKILDQVEYLKQHNEDLNASNAHDVSRIKNEFESQIKELELQLNKQAAQFAFEEEKVQHMSKVSDDNLV
jgi:hypothetical protein